MTMFKTVDSLPLALPGSYICMFKEYHDDDDDLLQFNVGSTRLGHKRLKYLSATWRENYKTIHWIYLFLPENKQICRTWSCSISNKVKDNHTLTSNYITGLDKNVFLTYFSTKTCVEPSHFEHPNPMFKLMVKKPIIIQFSWTMQWNINHTY